ncbi:MAG: STAS domain-containing protein [Chitinivibrionales bacterium]|nr:STAS domain-containing protein [Chitinivibrionales bacterium]
MNIDKKENECYHLFSINEDLTLNSDINALYPMIHQSLESGMHTIVLQFTQDSYLSTRTITVLVNCFEDVKDHEGVLAMINPNNDILDVLSMIDLDKSVKFYPSEEKLKKQIMPVGSLS